MTFQFFADPLIEEMRSALRAEIAEVLSLLKDPHSQDLQQMLDYHLGISDPAAATGKQIRPIICLLSCSALADDWRHALPAAASIELIHSFSLIHDDIEDESDTRRGRPTLWNRWSIPEAINAGDALFVLARQSLSRLAPLPQVAPRTQIATIDRLDQAALDLTKGQHLDIIFARAKQITVDDYLTMVQGKTAALLQAAAGCGAILADSKEEIISDFEDFGLHLGLAFQILDDILGIWGSPEITGKPAGDDLIHRKRSLPTVFGLQHSENFRQMFFDPHSKATTDQMRTELDVVRAREHAQGLAQHHTRLATERVDFQLHRQPAGNLLEAISEALLLRQE